PDGMFHMVWTTGWWEKGIGYAHSRDLLKWSEQKCIEVMAHEGKAKNCWAPEVFYDEANGQYLIFWASTIPGRFPETEKKGDNNHRIYYVATKDFESFSRAKLLYEHGFNVIDATIVRDGRQYLMFLKDETVHPPQKNIRLATAKAAEGPYSEPSQAITGQYWAEGPTAIKIGDTWFVYFDKYRERSYGVVVSKDLKNWADVSDKLQFPKGSRHGTILQVSNRVLDKLMGKEQAALPNVLIIGDSISIGYFPSVKELLEDKAVVVHNPGNAQHTRFGLDKLDQWLGQSKWDVIHFNHGLHDLKYVDEKGKNVPVEKGRQQVPIDEYEKNLEELVKRLKSTGAALIFASTTPVPDGTGIRVQGDAKKYNVVAERVMKKHGVAVNDLYSFAMLRLGEIQRPKNVHFNDAGSRLLAEQVAVAILSKLE
ncbi:MAG: family 43 glycosylhydrolase, partial [Sedimentisphaerales bacterium]|nr:family 43 glycosylhydrolase [Sedimentisphaerales bacterium]